MMHEESWLCLFAKIFLKELMVSTSNAPEIQKVYCVAEIPI